MCTAPECYFIHKVRCFSKILFRELGAENTTFSLHCNAIKRLCSCLTHVHIFMCHVNKMHLGRAQPTKTDLNEEFRNNPKIWSLTLQGWMSQQWVNNSLLPLDTSCCYWVIKPVCSVKFPKIWRPLWGSNSQHASHYYCEFLRNWVHALKHYLTLSRTSTTKKRTCNQTLLLL